MLRILAAVFVGIAVGLLLTGAGHWLGSVAFPVSVISSGFAPLHDHGRSNGPFGNTVLQVTLGLPVQVQIAYVASCTVGSLAGAVTATVTSNRKLLPALAVGAALAVYEWLHVADIPQSTSFSLLVSASVLAAATVGGLVPWRLPLTATPLRR